MQSPSNAGPSNPDGGVQSDNQERSYTCTECRFELLLTGNNVQCKACHHLAHLKCTKITTAIRSSIKGVPLYFLCQSCIKATDSGDLNSEHVKRKYADLTSMVKEREKLIREMREQINTFAHEKVELQQQIINLNVSVKRKKEEANQEDFAMVMGKMDKFVDDVKGSFNDLKTVVQAIGDKGNQETQNMIANTKSLLQVQ